MFRSVLMILSISLVLLFAAAAVAGLAPGDQAPAFTLTDTEGTEHSLQTYLDEGKTVVIEWFNPDCPFIKKHHANHKTMNETFAGAKDHGVVWLAIKSSAPGKEGHGLDRNKKAVEEYEMPFPVMLDESGEVGRAYGAKTTPHMFIIAADGTIAYNGAIDSDRSADKLGDTNYVAAALKEMAAEKKISTAESQPYGCSVKYAK
jgi:peroxiredoxin